MDQFLFQVVKPVSFGTHDPDSSTGQAFFLGFHHYENIFESSLKIGLEFSAPVGRYPVASMSPTTHSEYALLEFISRVSSYDNTFHFVKVTFFQILLCFR